MSKANTLHEMSEKVSEAIAHAKSCCNGENDKALIDVCDQMQKAFDDLVVRIIQLSVAIVSLKYRPASQVHEKLEALQRQYQVLASFNVWAALSPDDSKEVH